MKWKNLPNLLSMIRILLAVAFIPVYMTRHTIWALIIFCVAGITDFLDGFLARRYRLTSRLGAVLDPLADKMMLIFVFICFVIRQHVPVWMLVVILCRELLMIVAGALLYHQKYKVKAGILGKISTVTYIVGIFLTFFDQYLYPWNLYVLGFAMVLSIMATVNYAWISIKNGPSNYP